MKNKDIKIHIFGASGAGVSSLGRELASNLQIPFYDADDFYWKKTDPPFVVAAPIEERKHLIKNAVSVSDSWVVAGTLVSWGDFIQDEFDLAVYLYVPREERVSRVRRREAERFANRIEVGGDMYDAHLKFIDWVAQYDEGYLSGRSKPKHEAWIKTLKCPILRIDGIVSVQESLMRVLEYLNIV
jgi:adenylate kinase family enzyme